MGFISRLFSAPDAIKETIGLVGHGIDKAILTQQEGT